MPEEYKLFGEGEHKFVLDMLNLMCLQDLEVGGSNKQWDLRPRFGGHWPMMVTEAVTDRRGLRTDTGTSGAVRKESGSRHGAGDVKRNRFKCG